MQLMRRDIALIRLVGRFGQLDSGHVKALIFQDVSSNTPCDRRLKALTKSDYLRRVGRRSIKGDGRGTGRYVYQLGAEGWRVCRKRKAYKQPYRAVNDHTMAIVDAYVAVKRLEADGRYKVHLLATELDDAHERIEGVTLTPDLYLEVRDSYTNTDHLWWLEVDRGFEGERIIHEKLDRYVYAWRASGYELDDYDNVTGTHGIVPFPLVVFLEEEASKLPTLQRFFSRYRPEPADDGGEDPMNVFSVMALESFPQSLL